MIHNISYYLHTPGLSEIMESFHLQSYSNEDGASIVIFGASGDLSKRKIFPSLFRLFHCGYLKEGKVSIIGYARTMLSDKEFQSRLIPFMKLSNQKESIDSSMIAFFKMISYYSGSYEDLSLLKNQLKKSKLNIFYLALPPTQFLTVSKEINRYFHDENTRIVIEKPFGRDLDSSIYLSDSLALLFRDNQLYHIDHYLEKEMVKNLFTLRFANFIFRDIWNSRAIDNVQITFKETIGIEGRGSYFDDIGIVRDVLQNHLLQLLSIVAMKPPENLTPEHIRKEKVSVLNQIRPISLKTDVILGQYEGYKNEPDVSPDSNTPTFAAVIMYIDDDRWKDVPFILKCGKGLDQQKAEIRIQFKDVSEPLVFSHKDLARNELVIKIQPNESIYLKMIVKRPGLSNLYQPVITELDLTMREKFSHIYIPEAYESLLFDVFQGDQSHFVHRSELQVAWKIVDPLLNSNLPVHSYPMNSRGPHQADSMVSNRGGYKQSEKPYLWPKPE